MMKINQPFRFFITYSYLKVKFVLPNVLLDSFYLNQNYKLPYNFYFLKNISKRTLFFRYFQQLTKNVASGYY